MIGRNIAAFCAVAALGITFRTSWAQQKFPEARPLFSKLAVAPAKLSFGRTASRSKKFVIRNAGNAPLVINSVSLPKNPAFILIETPRAGSTLEPRAEATTVVGFQPPADGPFNATVSILTDATKGSSTASVRLTGTGDRTATISTLNPGSAVAGDAKFTLDVTGQSFSRGSKVRWNGRTLPTRYVSATELTARVPAADVSTVGTRFVTVSSRGGSSPASTFFVGSAGVAPLAQLEVNVEANDMAYDPARQVIYLSVPENPSFEGSPPELNNTIAVLDLTSGTITRSIFVGSNPDHLAISDDGQFLYAGLDDTSSVQRFILPALTPDITIPLGRSLFFGPYFALDLQVAPGNPHTIAVSLGVSNSSPHSEGGIVIFDEGSPRTKTAPGFFGGGNIYDSIQWGIDPTVIYAANNESGGLDFYNMPVDDDGITSLNDFDSAFVANEKRIHFDRGTGLIYSDNGQVIDPLTGITTGQFAGPNESPVFAMVPDSTINRAFFLVNGITSYNLTDLSVIDSVFVTGNGGGGGLPNRLIRWGNNGLAMNTTDGPVFIMGGGFVH